MDEKKKVLALGLTILLVLAAVAGIYLLFFRPGGEALPPVKKTRAEQAAGEESREADIPAFPGVSLDTSDDLIRRLARELTSHPRIDAWLPSTDIIRRIAAAVDAVAEGRSPAKQIDFFTPRETFKVQAGKGREFLDPASYERYSPAAEVFISCNARDCARFYKGLKPLFQDAYRELGYPDRDFDRTLKQALLELLAVPVVEGEVRLEKKVKTYMFADPALESLSEAQKHFLRMGPESVAAVQIKLRELALALGIPEESLPPQRTITAR
ncbi:MAG: hypothetical protein A2Y86_00300 [Candidatus Aminicenantes bacterium RBG_13_62_12]|nr:MAG: hypothetical protein A2Y86_00300 [Candidatus Aminicenantes bacterium RBG_13_62_12]